MDNENENFGSAAPKKKPRDVLFSVLDSSLFDSTSGITEDVEIGIMSMTSEEQIEIAKLCVDRPGALAIEQTKFCLRFWKVGDGPRKKVNHMAMEQESLWDLLGPRGQDAAIFVFVRQNRATDGEGKVKPIHKMRETFRTETADI